MEKRRMGIAARSLAVAVLALGCCGTNAASVAPVAGKNGMVVTAQHLATRVGVDVLKTGGNAVDAAVAVGYALAVVYPAAGFIDYFAGDSLVMLNQDETGRDSTCNLVFHDSVGKILGEAVGV